MWEFKVKSQVQEYKPPSPPSVQLECNPLQIKIGAQQGILYIDGTEGTDCIKIELTHQSPVGVNIYVPAISTTPLESIFEPFKKIKVNLKEGNDHMWKILLQRIQRGL